MKNFDFNSPILLFILTLLFPFSLPLVFAAPTQGLVGYWSFDEGSGATVVDQSGNGNTGTLTNGPLRTAGNTGGAISLDGVDDYISIPRSGNLEPNALTISLWVMFSDLDYVNGQGRLHGLAGKGYPDAGVPHAGWWFSYDNRNNRKSFAYTAFGNINGGYAGGGNNFGGSAYEYPFQNGVWYQLAISVSPAEARLYVNGVQVGPVKPLINTNLIDSSRNLSIGSLNRNFQSLSGKIDDVRIYNRVLVNKEISSLYTGVPLPSVYISSIEDFQTLSGTVSLAAIAEGPQVAGVRFTAGAQPIGIEDGTLPYSVLWDTTQVANGIYAVEAVMRDTANNFATSTAVTVVVYNPPPIGTPVLSSGFAGRKFIPTHAILYGIKQGLPTPSLDQMASFDVLITDPWLSTTWSQGNLNSWQAIHATNPSQHIALYVLGAGEYSLTHAVTSGDGWDWIKANHGTSSMDRWVAMGRTYGLPLQGDAYPNERLMELGSSNWRNYWITQTFEKMFGLQKIYDTTGADGIFVDNSNFRVSWSGQWGAEGLDQPMPPNGLCPGGSTGITTAYGIRRCVARDEPTTYFQNNVWLDDLWKIHMQSFFAEAESFFNERGKKMFINFGNLATNVDHWLDLNRGTGKLLGAMEEGGFLHPWGGDGISFKSWNWRERVSNLWALRGTPILALMTNHGNPQQTSPYMGSGRMDVPDANGMTGWDGLWFSLGSFLLSFDDVARNATLSFSVWEYGWLNYFDEFDPRYLHLGKALSPYTVLANGLYMREFEDGWVVVNPPGNPALVNVAVPAGQARVYQHATLRQNLPPLVTQFNLASMRSVILVREGRVVGNQDNSADLSLSLTATPGTVLQNNQITYTLAVTNAGPSAASNVSLNDTLPLGTSFVSVNPSTACTTGQTVSCNLGSLPAGATATVTLVARATTVGTWTNVVSVAAMEVDPVTTNNTASATTVITKPVNITGFWPTRGAPGTIVFVFGSDFVPSPGTTRVTVNGIPAPLVQIIDASLLFFILPAGNTAGPISVTTDLSSGTSAFPFGTPSAGIAITGVWPAQGSVGSFVFVFGAGFPRATTVSVNGLRVPLVHVMDEDLLLFLVPNGATGGPIGVQTPVGSAVSTTPFVVLP